MNSVYGHGFDIRAYWERWAETPDALAARFMVMIDDPQAINLIFSL
jgi:hypothetical protein